MATLYNTKISATYPGLIKTIDNIAITAALKQLTDGSGNATGLYLNNAGDFKVTSILEWGSLKDTGTGVTITQFVTAADGIGSFNNDTTVPTSAAVKTYVDAVVTASDLDFKGDSGDGVVDLDSQILDIAGTTNEIETSAAGQTLTIGLPNDVTIADDLTVTDVLTVNGTVLSNIIEGGLQINNSGGSHTVRIKDASGGNLFNTDPTNSRIAINKLTPTSTLDVNGTVTATTYIGDLNGTINTATTATTQTASDNSTKVATTAYVDTLDAASDLDTAGDSGTGDINLNTQSLAVTGTTNQIVTVAANQGISLAFPSTIVIPNGSTATTQSASDNSTKIATTAYVDVLDAASDLDVVGDSGTTDVNLNTQNFSILGTANQITTAVTAQTATLSLPSSINVNSASATILETARDISLTGQATATISSFNGSANVSGAVTLDNNSVTGKVLTGLPTPAAATVLPADSILDGIGKLQSQINGLAGGLRFIGSWNATANSPSLSSGGGEAASGTTTGTTADKLVDSAANFSVTVTVGDKVINQVDGQNALVTNIDSSTILSLDDDIIVSGEAYTIDNTPFLTQGHYYVVSVGGTTSLNGIANWSVGDWVIAGANNEWTQLDHTDVEGVGTVGNIPKWSATGTIADSIMSESGTEITVSGILSTTTNLNSGSNFAVATNKFTANATTGNVAFPGDLAINTDKFTVAATTGNTLVAGDVTVTSATDKGFIVNSTDPAYIRGLDIQHSGVSRAVFDFLPNSGEIRIGGITTADEYSVIYSDGIASLTFGLGTTPSATFVGTVETTTLRTDVVNNKANSANIIYRSGTDTIVGGGSAANKVTIQDAGNVGIGDSAPTDHKLQIHNAATYARFALTNTSTGVASGDGLIFQMETLNSIIKNQEVGYLAFGTSGRETDLYIDSSGNVGIETALPSEKFDTPNIVIGGASISGAYRANSLVIDNTGGASRFYSTGGDVSTKGSYVFNTTSSNGSISTAALTIASNTDATFGGVVNTTGSVIIDGSNGSNGLKLLRPTDSAEMTAITAPDSSTLKIGGGNQSYVKIFAHTTEAVSFSTTAATFAGDVFLTPTKKIYLGADTYIDEQSADRFQLIVGGAEYIDIDQDTTYATIGSVATNNKTNIKGGGTASVTVGDGSNNAFVGLNTTTPSYACDVNGTMRTSGLTTFESNVTIEGATPGTQSLIINGGVTSTFGISLQYAGVPRAVFDFYPGTGEIRIGGITTNDEYPVIYSDGIASLTFGLGATPSASFIGSVQFAAYGAGTLVTDASGNITASSDSSLKTRVDEKISGLDEVLELQPRAYYWNKDEKKNIEFGFFADEVKDIIPEAAPLHKEGTYGLLDRGIIAALVNSIQELNAKVEMLEKNCNCKN